MEEHASNQLLVEIAAGCGWVDRTFNPDLVTVLDELGHAYGPLGVAFAAATRTEPEALTSLVAQAFAHQRELWGWLGVERYEARQADVGIAGTWFVVDTEPGYSGDSDTVNVVATIESGPNGIDAEDSARAMASHLNNKIFAAKVAQATADTSAVTK